ncbi:MAG TPA: serine/threonine-protein kinase, partial [Xanthomonadales bacterium]|nr:serine/threonine-protein kinase [Xanthomonadales bacterium]
MTDVSFLVPGGALTGPLFASLIEGDGEPVLPNGTPIGQYRIAGVIGRGGSGIVYRAERSDGAFAQSVALKIVKPVPKLREHLRRERAILAQLGHPGIARLFDGGETREGEPWFAMELVSGRRIDHWCRANDAPWRTRLRLLGEVCDAVQYAHARLLVHRDIKPSNILVDEEGFARLLDFGISVALREPRGDESTYGFTPEFASPEQLAGNEVTTASDVYQLGRLVQVLMDPE